MNVAAYIRLMRFDKPVGILLLWFPVAWALWIANRGMPDIEWIIVFLMGTVLMRAAGCVINDIADRHFDKHVTRTKKRALTSGDVGLMAAFSLLILLVFLAFLVVIRLPKACFYDAILALAVTVLYPFCKRFLQAPQLILGIAFSMGIPMAYQTVNHPLDNSFMVLFGLNFAWIVAYDTMYAMADMEDDKQIGIKSTAILFGRYNCLIIFLLQLYVYLSWGLLGKMMHCSQRFYVCWGLAIVFVIYQQMLLKTRESQACFRAFLNNIWYGAWMWLALIVG